MAKDSIDTLGRDLAICAAILIVGICVSLFINTIAGVVLFAAVPLPIVISFWKHINSFGKK